MTGRLVATALGTACGFPVGAFAFWVLAAWTRPDLRIEEWKRPEDKELVVVSARPLPAGHVIRDEDLYAVQVPTRLDLPGVFHDPADVIGARATEDLPADEFLRRERLSRP